MVILCKTHQTVNIILNSLRKFLIIRGLEINEDKSKVIDFDFESFEFLGYEFFRHYKYNLKVQFVVSKEPISKIRRLKSNLRSIFKTKPHTRKSLFNCILQANPVIRGWANYYANAHNCHFVFNKLEFWLWHLVYYKLMRVYKLQYPINPMIRQILKDLPLLNGRTI
uniref:Group II intron maturase-specific domain-containing protein n=1 Tax=Caulerpa verticillata TaxID=177082 RepID=A0A386B0A1_9CHLO|nr:hypothetical protein [Caulerpa verticillata]AYC65120.1 hypothetical protein [Caulerpa verticillata]